MRGATRSSVRLIQCGRNRWWNMLKETASALVVASMAMASANADTLRPREAYLSHVATDVSALTYWSEGKSGYDVVTTLETKQQDSRSVVRFVSTLLPGQSQVIAVPGPVNSPSRILVISRIGDRVEIIPPPAAPTE
jgi:hypothetical protein